MEVRLLDVDEQIVKMSKVAGPARPDAANLQERGAPTADISNMLRDIGQQLQAEREYRARDINDLRQQIASVGAAGPTVRVQEAAQSSTTRNEEEEESVGFFAHLF